MNKVNISYEVLLSSLKTFTENENHKQKLFIQFFLGVIVVIIGYSFVYSDMEIDASIWEFHRKGSYLVITSYSISALMGAYIISQSVLILLSRIIVSGGYSFRKYQMVAYRIRKESLGKDFKKYYGYRESEFSPYNKNGSFSTSSYLPEFDTIFFVCIWLLQVLLFFSIIFKLSIFTDPTFTKISQPRKLINVFQTDFYLIRFWLIFILFSPLLFTAIFQKNYYFKYLEKVREVIPKFVKGKSNIEFIKTDSLRKYKRSISLTWGYIMFLFIFSLFLLFFLILNYHTGYTYLTSFDLIFLLSISISLWVLFIWNLCNSYKHFKSYARNLIPTTNILKRYLTECKIHFLKRSQTGKKYRIITPILIMIILLLILSSSIYLTLNFKNFNFLNTFKWPPAILFSMLGLHLSLAFIVYWFKIVRISR